MLFPHFSFLFGQQRSVFTINEYDDDDDDDDDDHGDESNITNNSARLGNESE